VLCGPAHRIAPSAARQYDGTSARCASLHVYSYKGAWRHGYKVIGKATKALLVYLTDRFYQSRDEKGRFPTTKPPASKLRLDTRASSAAPSMKNIDSLRRRIHRSAFVRMAIGAEDGFTAPVHLDKLDYERAIWRISADVEDSGPLPLRHGDICDPGMVGRGGRRRSGRPRSWALRGGSPHVDRAFSSPPSRLVAHNFNGTFTMAGGGEAPTRSPL